MAYLLDTGILLRLVDKQDALHPAVSASVGLLVDRTEKLFTTTQNIAELWNVGTRSPADNGLGLTTEEVLR